jgi:hypothetical protein
MKNNAADKIEIALYGKSAFDESCISFKQLSGNRTLVCGFPILGCRGKGAKNRIAVKDS